MHIELWHDLTYLYGLLFYLEFFIAVEVERLHFGVKRSFRPSEKFSAKFLRLKDGRIACSFKTDVSPAALRQMFRLSHVTLCTGSIPASRKT